MGAGSAVESGNTEDKVGNEKANESFYNNRFEEGDKFFHRSPFI